MADPIVQELRDQIRGVTGGLLVVGVTFHYTMETWWLGWTLPLHYLVGYAVVGLAMVLGITRAVGFREEERNQAWRSKPKWYVAVDSAEVLTQSFVASYTILLVMGIIDASSSLDNVVRLGLIMVVPLGFGAALANRVFASTDETQVEKEAEFPRNVATFALGAVFVSSTIAPTQEMELISAYMGWTHHFSLIALTIVLVYLILYELEFRGQRARVQQARHVRVGNVFLAYVIGTTSAFFMLLGFGHFIDATVALVYQETVVLAFPASLGAAAAEVVI